MFRFNNVNKVRFRTAAIVFMIVAVLLSIVNVKVDNPMLLLERFIPFGGWISVVIFSLYGGFICYKMLEPSKTAYYRNLSWMLFAIFFFMQFFAGLFFDDRFLMTGKLHIPIPMVILGGSVYRLEFGFMPVLFLSTILLSGPAWCSQLCYFGAFDNAISGRNKGGKEALKKLPYKTVGITTVIFSAILMRIFSVPMNWIIGLSIAFGFLGLLIILFVSSKKKKMIHCTMYCPIGTLVNLGSKIHPFQMYIDTDCNTCLKCSSFCKYDALSLTEIKNHKPGFTCTLCGDCVQSCHSGSIKYKFFKFSPSKSRTIYIATSIILHAVFMALARL